MKNSTPNFNREMGEFLYRILVSSPNPLHPIMEECEKLGLTVKTSTPYASFLIGSGNSYFGGVKWSDVSPENVKDVVMSIYTDGLFT